MTMSSTWGSFAGGIPLAAVLACGAGVVVVTAAALSLHADRNPDLPAQRWSRPLPAALARAFDARAVRRLLPAGALLGALAGGTMLVLRGTPVNGLAVLAALTWLSLLAGPLYRRINPVRLLAPRPRPVLIGQATSGRRLNETDPEVGGGATAPPDGGAWWRAGIWLALLCAVLLSTRDPRLLAAAAVAHVAGQALVARRGPQREGPHRSPADRYHSVTGDPRRPAVPDPLDVLSELVGCLSPFGRDPAGHLVWRNPLVAAAHTELPRRAIVLGAVVPAAAVANALRGPTTTATASDGTAAALAAFVVLWPLAAVVLRLGIIRPFLSSTIVPLVAAYGTIAAGPWLPPLDGIAFVTLHAVAIALLHRQAIARHDLRTARAVQFPMRVVIMASVLAGLLALSAP